jgi:hypothetical protein
MVSVRHLSRLTPLASLVLLNLVAAWPAVAQKVWFVPHAGPQGVPDYMDLFRPGAPWQQAASHVAAFEISGEMAALGPEGDLKQIIDGLRSRNIALAAGAGMLDANVNGTTRCGYHVEGFSAPGEPNAAAKHIKASGGVAQYFAMEAIYYGHFYSGPNACHASIANIARGVAEKVRQIHATFPQAQFGDVEPLQAFPQATWLADVETWLDAFQADTGQRLAFFRLDLDWTRPWQQLIPPLAQLLHRKGVALQIIYDSDVKHANVSDEQAIANSIANFREYESDGRSPPDAGVIQFWSKYPSRVLPETDPRTATYLINQYVKWRQSSH